MKDKLFIAKKIKVGFNLRDDTYTGKLGYVIGFDGKKWRKEPSWEGWRQKEGQQINEGYERDENGNYIRDESGRVKQIFKTLGSDLNPIEYDNVPTEGFVLNKKVGGVSYSSWNPRQTYCRVYDPRGFEFEISIPNLLFILQETNSIKGKGLEGEFVYSWDGKDLVLLPVCSIEYKQSMGFTEAQHKKVGVKDLVPGGTYLTKQLQSLVYLGKFNFIDKNWRKGYFKIIKHVFINPDDKLISSYSGLSSFSSVVNKDCISNYAELMDYYNSTFHSSEIEEIIFTPKPLTIGGEYNNSFHNENYTKFIKEFGLNNNSESKFVDSSINCMFQLADNSFGIGSIECVYNHQYYNRQYSFHRYRVIYYKYELIDGLLKQSNMIEKLFYSKEELLNNINLVDIKYKLKNGKILTYEQYR